MQRPATRILSLSRLRPNYPPPDPWYDPELRLLIVRFLPLRWGRSTDGLIINRASRDAPLRSVFILPLHHVVVSQVVHEHLLVALTDGNQPLADLDLVFLDELNLVDGNHIRPVYPHKPVRRQKLEDV